MLRQRDIKRMVQDAGLTLVSAAICGSGHWRLRVRRSDGQEATCVMPCTPGDHRGLLNKASELRRFARGVIHLDSRRPAALYGGAA